MKRLYLLPLINLTLFGQVSSTVYLPHIADGGGWKTTFTIVNLSGNQGEAVLRFHAENGGPLPLSLLGAAGNSVSQVPVVIPPNGIQVLETLGGSSALTVGWAELSIQSSGSLGISAVFRQRLDQRPDFEASVSASSVITKPITFPYDNTSGFATGIAIINGSPTNTGTISVVIRDDSGQILQTDAITLAPGAHLSFSLGARYAAAVGFRGTIGISPDLLIWLDAVAFRFNPTGPFTTVAPLMR